MILWCVVLTFVLLLIFSCEVVTFKTGLPTVTSFPSARKKMIELLKVAFAERKKEKGPLVILDLGSGTGKLTLEIAKALPEARVIGVEISVVPFLLSKAREYIGKWVWGIKNVEYLRQDFWSYTVPEVDAVVLFVNGNTCERMAQKLKAELPSGTPVISNEVFMPNWTPKAVHEVGFLKTKVVVYKQD